MGQASPGNLGLVELARLERVDLHMQMQMEEDEGYEGAKRQGQSFRCHDAEAGASGWASPPPSGTFLRPLQAAAALAIRTP